jgi:hypothetical protein
MRMLAFFPMAAIGLLLAACSAGRPIPEWAMHPEATNERDLTGRHARRHTPSKIKVKFARNSKDERRMHSRQTSIGPRRAEVLKPLHVTPSPTDDPIPFTTQWYEREDARDAHLRSKTRICGAC